MIHQRFRQPVGFLALLALLGAVSGCGYQAGANVLNVGPSAVEDSWDGRIYDAETGQQLTMGELLAGLAEADNIVLGEKHYTEAIQNKQAAVIAGIAGQQPGNLFTTAWEFLNVADQESIRESFAAYKRGEITGEEFLVATQGSANALTYLPILRVTAQLGGEFIGTNLSRAQKAPVVRGGLEAANPDLIPPGFAMGSELYYERFVIAMEDHVMPGTLDNFYDAQCLTDDVMAYSMLGDAGGNPRFLVVGSFHSDFLDGVVDRIAARAPGEITRAVRFIDASDYTEDKLSGLVRHDRYGKIADYVVYVNEPIVD